MTSYSHYYFIGIGGIGMSAIARYFKHQGYEVSGYDRTPSALTRELEAEGIAIHYEDDVTAIPQDIPHTLVIYTPAIPEDFKELQYVRGHSYPLCKRSKALGEIARGQECLAVSGTHGKTTTSTLLAHILTAAGEGCSAFLGGISKNYDTNLLLSRNPVLVAEADEFDRSFLQLHPHIAVVTATDADHLDIYNDHAHVVEAFGQFTAQVDADGAVVVKHGVDVPLARTSAKVWRYAYDTPCDFYASDIRPLEGGRFDFTLNHPGGRIEHCSVGIPGWVNVENAVAASAIALLHGTAPGAIRDALASFQGVKRRFDIHVNTPRIAYIDDYAHHPNEIKAAISSMRNIFPGRTLLGIFQPHLYTRTRDFASEFAEALSGLDALILLPIYPAREEPIPGVNAELIFDKVTLRDKVLIPKEQLMDHLKTRPIDCLVTFGAGDVDRFIEPIANWLKTLA
ncbi:MAG: UDP-N-acetylmuramate--L-alanine ligase [Bacteroidales bacterium]|nr:UDP-N-acetylmuramate--L-alanine ligase [Bacteroidales bacterium]